jgi:RimJ/RimL family protein N-acetyltransferase
MSVSPGELAARLPDAPRLVETRAILLSGACEVLGDGPGGNYMVRSLDTALAAVVGRPSEGLIREAASRQVGLDILCAEDVIEHTVAALPEWSAGPAAVHVLAQRRAPPPRDGPLDVRLVAEEQHVPLTHVPPELRRELEAARRRSPFSIAFSEGRAVSFAYVPWQTEGLYDLSIDTLEAYRQRGLGAATVGRLIEHLRAGGKQPVWGAMEDNGPSLRLAARLGFVPVDRLFVLSRRPVAKETR